MVDVIKVTHNVYVPTASNETFKNLDPFWGPFTYLPLHVYLSPIMSVRGPFVLVAKKRPDF